MRGFDRKLRRSGLQDKPIEFVVGQDGFTPEDFHIVVSCPRCGKTEELHGTRFIPASSENEDQEIWLEFHEQYDCPRPSLGVRWIKVKWAASQKVLGLFGYRRTPFGIKHKSWKPNIRREE